LYSCPYLFTIGSHLQDGTVANLRARGTKIHPRSLYLQGLLLTPTIEWPNWVSSEMWNHHKNLEKLAEKRNCRLIDLALGFAKAQTVPEAVVVGPFSTQEHTKLEEAWAMASPWQEEESQDWALHDIDSVDPRSWPH